MSSRRIVIVDTNLFFSQPLAAEFRRLGFDPAIEAAPEAVVRLASGAAGVIVNLKAPGIDPLAIVRRLKSSEGASSVPIAGFSGHAHADLMDQAREAGCEWVETNGWITSHLPELAERFMPRQEVVL